MTINPIQVSRYILGLSWMYQGYFPKLFTIAPLEQQLTGAMGFSLEVSNLITRVAGVGEIIFGLLLIIFYRDRVIHILNILALLGLLLYVILMMPVLLVEAFNPVTTNLTLIGLSLILISDLDSKNFE